jgi:hypothetical protein
MNQPTVNRPAFNPNYFQPGKAFRMYSKTSLAASPDLNQHIRHKFNDVIVAGFTDNGETLDLVGVFPDIVRPSKDPNDQGIRKFSVRIAEFSDITFHPLEVGADGNLRLEEG